MKTHTKYFKYIQLFSKKVVAKKGKNCTQQSLKAIWVSSNQWILTIQINNFIQPTMPRSYYDFSQISLKSWGKRKKYQRYFRMLFYTFFPQLFSKQLYIKYLLCVVQGFPALRKAAKTLMEKYDIFSRPFDIANQPLTRHSPFAQLRQVDEWTAKPSPFSIHGRLSQFCRIMATKTLKNHHRLKTVTSKLS